MLTLHRCNGLTSTEHGAQNMRDNWITSCGFEMQEWKDAHGNKRQERHRKKGRQLQAKAWRGRRGCGEQGGLQAERHVNGERQATLTLFFFLLTVSCAAVAVCFLYCRPPPSLPAPVFLFCFLWLAKLAKVHCFSWTVLEGLKIRAAVLRCEIVHFIKYLRQRETGDGDLWLK